MSHLSHQKVGRDAKVRFRLERLGKRSGLGLKGLVEKPLQGDAGIDDVEQSAGTVVSEFADGGDGIGHRAVRLREAFAQFINSR